jgi:putative phage-type endonuclease
MIHFHHAMLSPVLDIVKSTQSYIPTGDHTTFQKLWDSEVLSVLNTTAETAEFTPKEKKQANQLLRLISDAVTLFTRAAENTPWIQLSLDQRDAIVKRIQAAPQIPQRSEEWYKNFGKVLTASEFSALFSYNKRRKDLVMSKANPPQEQTGSYRLACPTEEMNAIGWGIRFEPVVKQLIEHRDKCKIYEPGRIQHSTNTTLAASPDGVFESSSTLAQVGRLVEIKCPYSRAIGGEIPSEYWIQMQIQMEVTDVDECEYIEVTLVSTKPGQEKLESMDLSGTTYQGCAYLIKQIVPDGEAFEYKYLYGEIGSSCMPPIPDGFICIETIPWGLKAWHRKIVSRDRTWYEATKPWQEAFWDDVGKIRRGEEIPMNASKPKPKSSACLITDD